MRQLVYLIIILLSLCGCSAARKTAASNEPDSHQGPTEVAHIDQSIDLPYAELSDTTKAIESNELYGQDVPSRIMVMDHSADFPHSGGERTIYTFSHKGWMITKVETRNPDDPDLKSIPLTPIDTYAGEWYSLTVPEEGNSLVIKTEQYSGRRYRELYVTMYAGNIGRKITVLQYSPGKYGEYLRYNDSYDVRRTLIISGGKGEEENIREKVADKMPSGGPGQWITFRKHNDEWYMDICKGILVYDDVTEIDSGKMSIEPMNPDSFDLEDGIDAVKVMRWEVDFDKSGKREFIAVISPLKSPSVNTDYQILLYEDLTKEINTKGRNLKQVLLKYILTDVNQTDPMPSI